MSEFLKSNYFEGTIDLLPYHKYGIKKYKDLGWLYELSDIKEPEKEVLTHIAAIYESEGLSVRIH